MAKRKRPRSKNGRIMSHAPRVWGYARVSTDDQDMKLQIDALEKYGVDGIFKEKKSGKDMERPALKQMFHEVYLRGNDTIVVWKLDRLGRSLTDLIEIVQFIEDCGARFVSLTDNIDTSTATGRFFLHIIAAMAEWERNMISERTKAGIAAAKAEGKRFGPEHKIKDNPKRIAAIRALDNAGKLLGADGEQIILDAELLAALNAADPDAKPIESMETVRRWRREGYPGLEKSGE